MPTSSVTSRPSASLCGAQFLAEQAHELAAPRGGNVAPLLEGLRGAGDFSGGVAGFRDGADLRAVDGGVDAERAALELLARDAEGEEEVGDFGGEGHGRVPRCGAVLPSRRDELVKAFDNVGVNLSRLDEIGEFVVVGLIEPIISLQRRKICIKQRFKELV